VKIPLVEDPRPPILEKKSVKMRVTSSGRLGQSDTHGCLQIAPPGGVLVKRVQISDPQTDLTHPFLHLRPLPAMAPAPAAASAGRKSHVTVLLLYVVCGLILLLLLASYSPRLQPHAHGRSLHRRLKLHPKSSLPSDASSGGNGGQQKTQHQNHHAASFDPTIAELERRLDDKEWEREHYSLLHGGEPDDHMKEWEEFLKEEEDFINDDDRFNIADRIRALFPKIDVAPQDGFVSLDELTAWNLQQARADQHHRSAREMELYNKNGDEIVSFEAFNALRQESHGNIAKILYFCFCVNRAVPEILGALDKSLYRGPFDLYICTLLTSIYVNTL
jgi:hypothetical protein